MYDRGLQALASKATNNPTETHPGDELRLGESVKKRQRHSVRTPAQRNKKMQAVTKSGQEWRSFSWIEALPGLQYGPIIPPIWRAVGFGCAGFGSRTSRYFRPLPVLNNTTLSPGLKKSLARSLRYAARLAAVENQGGARGVDHLADFCVEVVEEGVVVLEAVGHGEHPF
jgi:hypothetical protein